MILREKVYWPCLDKDVEEYISNCTACLANTNIPTPVPYTMSELPASPWSDIAIDFFGPLPTGETLLVVIDLYTRFPLVEVMKRTTVELVIERLENIFSIFGYPESIKRDNGPPFSSHEFKNYLKTVNVTDKPITPEHPEANAIVENFNRSLKKIIRTAKFEQKNWRREMSIFLHSYRNAPHVTTEKTPALLFFNRQLKTYLPFTSTTKVEHMIHEVNVADNTKTIHQSSLQYTSHRSSITHALRPEQPFHHTVWRQSSTR